MLGNLGKTFDSIYVFGCFGIHIAKHIQRAEILWIIFNHPFIFVNCRASLALGKKSFGISTLTCKKKIKV